MNLFLPLWLVSAALLLGQAGRWMSALRRLGRPAGGGAEGCAAPVGRVWILVAARDEAESLPALAQALLPQLGEESRLLLVDDGSRDGSAGRARQLFSGAPQSTILERTAAGKPAALATGLEWILARAGDEDAVLFTDADCRPAAGWVESHLRALAAGADLLCGHVQVETEGGTPADADFRRFENAVSSLQCALGCALGRPGFARGGNWSCRAGWLRRVEAAALLSGLASGDDVHLVRALVRSGARPRFLLEAKSRVVTRESARGADLARQARRRYGKLRELSAGEIARQGGLFAALFLQVGLLALWGLQGSLLALLPLALLVGLALAARRGLARGLEGLGEKGPASRPLGGALRLLGHAFTHSLRGGLGGYSWRSAQAGQERTR